MVKKSFLQSSQGVFLALILAVLSESLEGSGLEVLSHFRLNSSDVSAFEEGGANRNRIEVGPSGSLYVAFSGLLKGKALTNVFFRRSFPEGKWDELVQLSEEKLRHRAPVIWVGDEGRIHYAWLAHDDRKQQERVGLRYRKSEDGGASWSKVQGFDVGIVVARVPTLEGDGQGNLYLCISNKGKKEEQERIILFRSGDEGESWEQVDVHNGEERFAAVSAPRLVAGGEGKAYLAWLDPTPGGRAVVFVQSSDGGKSWSKAVPLNDDLSRVLSDPEMTSDQDRIRVTWVEMGSHRSSIYVDYSDDGGESWHPDQLLYQEPVKKVSLKITQMHDRLLVLWEDYRDLLWQRGERLLYRLYPQEEAPEEKELRKQSLTGSLDNLLSFRGFEVVPVSDEGCVGVYSKKTLNGRPTIYVSWSQKLIEGFEEVLAVSKDDGTMESLWPRVRKINDKELVILYNQHQAPTGLEQTRRQLLGNLILTRVRLQDRDPRSGHGQSE